MFFQEMETDRLLLKNISRKDRDFIFGHFSDETVSRYLFDAEPMGDIREADALIDFYTRPEPRMQHRWILTMKSGGAKIGTCGFHYWDPCALRTDVGYDLREAAWGQGYMTEALGAILLFARQNMGVREIRAHIYDGNPASIRLAEKLGFQFEGETELCEYRGRQYPHRIYTLRFY